MKVKVTLNLSRVGLVSVFFELFLCSFSFCFVDVVVACSFCFRSKLPLSCASANSKGFGPQRRCNGILLFAGHKDGGIASNMW